MLKVKKIVHKNWNFEEVQHFPHVITPALSFSLVDLSEKKNRSAGQKKEP